MKVNTQNFNRTETAQEFTQRKTSTYKSILRCLEHNLALITDRTVVRCSGCDNDGLCGLLKNQLDRNYSAIVKHREERIKREAK